LKTEEKNMNKFKDMEYIRPDMNAIGSYMQNLLKDFEEAETVDDQIKIIDMMNKERGHIETMMTLSSVRHSVDTMDKFYDEENKFFDENLPKFQDLEHKFYVALNNSKFKKELKNHYGDHLFDLIEVKLKTFDSSVMEDLKEENLLVSEYVKLTSSAQIEYKGEKYNLSQMTPFLESKSRAERKEAYEIYMNFFKENESKFDEIYDKLVKIRDKIAKKLGFKNFIQLAYYRMERTDYNADDVKNFREQVLKDLVPLATELREKQRKRLELSELKYYDEKINFKTGNATPKGTSDWIMDNGKKMYHELSTETDEFFKFMNDNELLDLLAKKGKAPGGYCTFIYDFKAPYIFSNFNGTAGDIGVLTHEAGHAFQIFSSRDKTVPEYLVPTCEACEIHSMSMEFFTWPWMKLFFKDEELKYKYAHLADAVLFIPYGVTVDEFQHYVYENPEVTPEKRKEKWREIEKKYLPHRDYEDNDFLNRGGIWFRQGHIFQVPFYYIDYTLAQICALQFWVKNNKNHEGAWKDYLKLCKEGGSKSFTKLLQVAGLKNPFNEGSIVEVSIEVRKWLENVNDLEL
jgi:M3 family oligoendopeptidase